VRAWLIAVGMLGAAGLAARAGEAEAAAQVAFFESKIRPVLAGQCYGCHSAEAREAGKLKGGLSLDTRDGLMRGGESGPAVVPGSPEQSLLLRALKHESKDLAMPAKGEKLADAVIADFARWIAEGAADPRRADAPPTRQRGMSLEAGRQLWSLIPPRRSAAPEVRDAAWPRGEIDRFVLKGLEEAGLKPNPEAAPSALIRRLHLDLTGLPAPVSALGEGAGDWDALIGRLLDSPHFGERWGRHWLDIARYADSNGRDRNVIFHHAWRYRDYVIAAFNDDKPYDVFLREQIAGDLMPAASPAQRDERLTATAFLALGAKAYEEQKQDLYWMDVVDEQIEVIGRGILGLSVACARCHDHKFDPIPTADYYALAGILRSTEPLYGYGPRGIKATMFHHTDWHAIGPDAGRLAPAALEYYRRLDADMLAMHTARSDRYRLQRRQPDAKLKIESAKTPEEKAAAEAEQKKLLADIEDWHVKIAALEKGVADLQDAAPPQPGWTMGARDRGVIADSRIHIRGETTNLGETVRRGYLQVVSLPDVPAPAADGSGRLELAAWLTHREHPLTARVLVNRVWQKLMGRALVATPDDFGVNGARPSHPELLDHLAVTFMERGWSVKELIREITRSSAYRMSSDANATALARDPDNVLLWRMAPRPVEVEVLRDSILALSGRLDPYPPREPFLDRFHPRRDAELFSFKPFLTTEAIVSDHRSVYLPIVRGILPEMYPLFDFAPPERPVAQREESVLPAQALFLMNNPWVIEQAGHAARRLLGDTRHGDDAARVRGLYELAYGRPPTTPEVERALDFLRQTDEILPDPKGTVPPTPEMLRESRWTGLCQMVIASAEFRVVR
jgi:cytochrome c553